MSHSEPGQLHGQFAGDDGGLTREFGRAAAEVLFGLPYEYVLPSECLLEVGIGSGLSSAPFVLRPFCFTAVCAPRDSGIQSACT